MKATTIPTAAVPAPAAHSRRQIELRGVRVHNLKQIDLDLPLGQLVVVSGVSGSGKSSLAFDTIFAEGQRRYIESFSASARQYLERIERPNADRIAHVPPTIAIRTDSTRAYSANDTVATLAEIGSGLQRLFARIGQVTCPGCGTRIRSHSADDVRQAVELFAGGTRLQLCFEPAGEDAGDPAAWLARGFSRAIVAGRTCSLADLSNDQFQAPWIVVDRVVAGKTSPERITESAETAFREGNGRCIVLADPFPPDGNPGSMAEIDGRSWHEARFSRHWECAACQRAFLPPQPHLFEPAAGGGCRACGNASSPAAAECPVCHGTRLCAEALAVRIGGRNLADLLQLTCDQARELCGQFERSLSEAERSVSHLIRDELQRRMSLVIDVGLGHLTLLRPARTLTGGQIRRLMLAAAIGSRITGTLCVVDEPSAGLHVSETPLVIAALRRLIEQRNSVLVVDHSAEIIRAADYLVDLGPAAGPWGGTVVFTGPPTELLATVESATSRALHPANASAMKPPRLPSDWLTLNQVRCRNLHDLSIRIPLGVLCVISGPGGCGKTSLVADVMVPAVRERLSPGSDPQVGERCGGISGGESLVDVAVVNRSPLTRSPRSNAATWIEVFDEIRDVFAMTADARTRGFGPQHFSFNATQGGRCRACRGTGVLRHDMQFLPDVTLTCPECGGTRYRREILEVKYRGRSIAEVLDMCAADAATFFRNHPRLHGRLQMLKQIGLDYLVLGQPTDTLSGGEAQRLKLAARLTASRGPTLIVCDEPSAGLHPADVARLIGCFDELLGIGHSVVVIDNSPDLLRAADHIIELGPGAGDDGGRIIREGPRPAG